MEEPKLYVSIKGVITKNDKTAFTEKEYNRLYFDILQVVDKHNCGFGGGSGHHTEEEMIKIIDNE